MTILPVAERAAGPLRRRSTISFGPSRVAVVLGIALASSCAVAVTPEQTAEGALRSKLDATVAPNGYRSGVLPAELAEAWRARVMADVRIWYGDNLGRSHLVGLENVTSSLMEQPGPIVTSVNVRRIDIPRATIQGDTARIDMAAIEYVTQYAPGTWNEERVDGTTMCRFDLRRVGERWLIEDETCNVSGG